MIFGEFGGERVPFSRPVQASGGFLPRSFDVRMNSDINYMPLMPPLAANLPSGIRLPVEAEPGGGPAARAVPLEPTAPATAPVKGFGMFGTFGAAERSPLARARRGLTTLPAFATRAILASKLRARAVNPMPFISRGRSPGR